MKTIYLLFDLLSENNTDIQTDSQKKILPGNPFQVNPDNLHPKHGIFGVKKCPTRSEIDFLKKKA